MKINVKQIALHVLPLCFPILKDETQQKKRVNEGHDQPSTSRKRLRTTEQRTDRELPLLYNTDREVQDEEKSATEEAKEEIRNAYLGKLKLPFKNVTKILFHNDIT